ncbi:MAG: small-conductance mechanosensitive ion channel [Chloroflexi bacterium]|nr:small-conductance mechanosensitive ion channel [Chloroflexota bacterium]
MQAITDWGVAIWTSLTSALMLAFSFIPKLIGFLVILLVGWLVASALEKVVTLLLRKVGFDRIANRIGLTSLEQRMNLRMDAAGVLGKIVYWFVFLVFLIPAVDALGLTTVSSLLSQVIAYIPNVFVAILILFLGTLAATFVADVVRGATASANIGNANVFANIARYAILGFVAIIALEQLQIAPAILNILFTAIVGALALAFGLAFGLGGRESAQRWLMRGESNLTTTAARINAQQAVQQDVDRTPTEQYAGSRYNPQQPHPQQ